MRLIFVLTMLILVGCTSAHKSTDPWFNSMMAIDPNDRESGLKQMKVWDKYGPQNAELAKKMHEAIPDDEVICTSTGVGSGNLITHCR